ncbi:hypothetical protein GDO86_019980 [Hymenochirus boettgeri]|uniref:Uncharacterized protein n=1 Tax=Hymenochirus boettgeri TaxID=247094 RepID=A0A8T2II29_9PIPI|nr:hypothetical protein GDO86_019980 [Hymenochirus boettgeri]
MADPYTCVITAMSRILLCASCFWSAARTFQEHRGASAGFLLQGVASILYTTNFLMPTLHTKDESYSTDSWGVPTIGFPLLAFSFFWMNGDHATANMVLGATVLLSAGSGLMTQDGRLLAAHASCILAILGILIVSIFTGNIYGITGSFGLGTASFLSIVKAENIIYVPGEVASNYIQAASILSCALALGNHQPEVLYH